MVTTEVEEEVTNGVVILKLSVLLSSNTAIFHIQVEVHIEISFNFQLMVQKTKIVSVRILSSN